MSTRNRAYYQHIQSARWKEFIDNYIAKHGKICEHCGVTKGYLTLHHLSYENFRNETEDDVVLLCKPCHKIADKKRMDSKRSWNRAARLEGVL